MCEGLFAYALGARGSAVGRLGWAAARGAGWAAPVAACARAASGWAEPLELGRAVGFRFPISSKM